MKIIRFAACLSVLCCVFHSMNAQKDHNIKITVHGLQKDSLCHLAKYFGDKQYLSDSAKADANHTVIFKNTEPLPGGIYLFVLPDKKYFEMVIDKEQHFSMETDTSDFVKNMKIIGSQENILFYDYLKYIGQKSAEMEKLKKENENAKTENEKKAVREKMENMNKEVIATKIKFMQDNPGAFMTKVFKTSQEPEMPPVQKKPDGSIDSSLQFYAYRAHFFDNIDMTDDRLLRTPVLFPKIEQYIKKLTPQIPDSINAAADYVAELARPNSEVFKFVIWWITNTYETSNLMGMDAVFVHMAENYYTANQAFWVDSTTLFKIQDRAKKLKPILIGKKAKNIVLADSAGKYHALYDIKTPYTILYFWDPDCGHCKKVTPVLKEIYDKYKSKGVEVYAVDNEVEIDKWKKYISENKLSWINVADPEYQNNFRYDFDVSSTPQIFLLDESKTIVAKRIDVETLKEILEKKFEEKNKDKAGK